MSVLDNCFWKWMHGVDPLCFEPSMEFGKNTSAAAGGQSVCIVFVALKNWIQLLSERGCVNVRRTVIHRRRPSSKGDEEREERWVGKYSLGKKWKVIYVRIKGSVSGKTYHCHDSLWKVQNDSSQSTKFIFDFHGNGDNGTVVKHSQITNTFVSKCCVMQRKS